MLLCDLEFLLLSDMLQLVVGLTIGATMKRIPQIKSVNASRAQFDCERQAKAYRTSVDCRLAQLVNLNEEQRPCPEQVRLSSLSSN
jgi:hypothetical protein